MHMSNTPEYQPPDSPEVLVLAWIQRARESQFAHYRHATELSGKNNLLGIPVIALTTLVGTSVFMSLSEQSPSTAVRIAVGSLSLLAAVLAGLQTFMKFSERCEKHRSTAARYGIVRRQLEQHYAAKKEGEGWSAELLDSLRTQLDNRGAEAPEIPLRTFKIVQEELNAMDRANE